MGTAVPSVVRDLAAGQPVRPVWENELGGLTFELGTGAARRFVKWAPVSSGIDLVAETARLAWAEAFTPVPRVLDIGADDGGAWLVTAALPGESAVTERWKADRATAVRAIGAGLRALHEALPVADCPFWWSAEERLTLARSMAETGGLRPERWHTVHRPFGIEEALWRVTDPPPVDRLVVCHGDACAPNTLLNDDGKWSGHVDFGALGVADRWADLAVATWSTEWNYGPGWERPLLDAYGIAPDPDRTRYYRLLWDLGA